VKQVNVRLEEDLLKDVKKQCLEKDITFQKAVELALIEWLKIKD